MRKVQLESAGDNHSRDLVEVIVDLGMGSIVRVTVTDQHVEWQFMEAGSNEEIFNRVTHFEAHGGPVI